MRIVTHFFIFSLLIAGCSRGGPENNTPAWRLVYQNDLNGKTLYGSRTELASAARRGSPVRVSWGEKLADGTSCVEFAVPDFITLNNDSDLVVQFPLSLIQTSYTDPARSFLKTNPPTEWRALMATDGHYHQFHFDIITGKINRITYARTNMSWYALVPPHDNRYEPVLAVENSFVLDSVGR